MLDFFEIADAIARKIVMGMADFELVDFMQENYAEYYAEFADVDDFDIEEFVTNYYAEYYAQSATEDEVVDTARSLGIEVESYLNGDDDEQL